MQPCEIYSHYLLNLTRKMGSLLEERLKNFCKLYLTLFLDTLLTLRKKKLGLIHFVTNIASLGPKEVGADQMLGPEFVVSFTVSSFRIDRYCIQQSFKCNTHGTKKVLRLGKFCGKLGPKCFKLAQHTMQFGLTSSLARI